MKPKPIIVVCSNNNCKNFHQEINRITDIEKYRERSLIVDNWQDACEKADHCKLCGELGYPKEHI